MNCFVRREYLLLVLFIIFVTPVTAYTTEVTVQRYATDGLTPITETTVSYLWMEANQLVYGDGTTHYFSQGPTFNESDYWDDAEWQNIESRDWGAVVGTDLKDLCDLVGGGSPGRTIRVTGSDEVGRDFSYESVYELNPRQGPMIVTWKKDGMYPESGYDEGMRLIMFADAKENTFGWNTSGWHVFGNADMRDCWQPQYWYNYSGIWPSSGGTSVKVIRYIDVFTSDPVPPPVVDFSANIKTGHIVNGNFETSSLTPWSGSGATIYTGTSTDYKHGNASVKVAATAGSTAWISQSVDLTDVSAISFYRDMFGGTGKYLQVFVDSTLVANYTEITSPLIATQTIDISSFGFTGTRTLKFIAVNTLASGSFTVYLDDIEDYGPGTSGNAPLTIQFKDFSTKMEDPAHTLWIWDFYNNGTATSTERNPLFTYTVDGTYSVKLTATNAGGSDSEIKTGYITVASSPDAGFSADVTSGTEPLVVQFTDESTNTPTSWRWAYKNATVDWTEFATTQDPEYTFPVGTYDINLTATNDAGSDDEIKTGYIEVTGGTSEIELTITGSIDEWDLGLGQNEDLTAIDMGVTTTAGSWTVGIRDALGDGKPPGTYGRMVEWTGSAYPGEYKSLSNPIQVRSGLGDYISLSDSDQIIQSESSAGTFSYDIGVLQEVQYGNSRLTNGNNYRIVITFTGSTP